MLQSLRASSKNIVVKFILILIAFTFVAWGIGDMLSSGSGSSVKVGNYAVDKVEIDAAVSKQVTNFERQIGTSLTEKQIKQFDFARAAFTSIYEGKLLLTRADDLQLQIKNDIVQNRISSEAIFKDDDGRFDKEKFELILRSNNVNEVTYVDTIKAEERRNLLTSFIEYKPTNFEIAAQISHNFKNETRKADLLYISEDAISQEVEPTSEEKQAFYDENKENFKDPEIRKVTYVKYGLDDVKKTIIITQEDIEREYNDNIDYFTEPEKRNFEQYLLASEEEAQKLFDNVSGDKLSEVKDVAIKLDDVTADSLPEKLSEVVFSGEVGKFYKPVKSDLGWHVIKLNKIIESAPKPINSVRSEIRRSVKENKASDLFYESISAIEDEFASGKNITEVAETFNMRIQKIESMNNQGLDKESKEIKSLPDKSVFIPLVFQANLNETSSLAILPDNINYVVVEVTNVEPERQKELAEVESDIIKGWKEKTKNDKLLEFATKTLETINETKSFSQFSEEMKGFEIQKDVEFVRAGDKNEKVPESLKKDLFELSKNDFTKEHQTSDGRFVIASLQSIVDAKEDQDAISKIEKTFKDGFADDLNKQYKTFLKNQYPVSEKKIAKLTN